MSADITPEQMNARISSVFRALYPHAAHAVVFHTELEQYTVTFAPDAMLPTFSADIDSDDDGLLRFRIDDDDLVCVSVRYDDL